VEGGEEERQDEGASNGRPGWARRNLDAQGGEEARDDDHHEEGVGHLARAERAGFKSGRIMLLSESESEPRAVYAQSAYNLK
jgi:hypothetical protein